MPTQAHMRPLLSSHAILLLSTQSHAQHGAPMLSWHGATLVANSCHVAPTNHPSPGASFLAIACPHGAPPLAGRHDVLLKLLHLPRRLVAAHSMQDNCAVPCRAVPCRAVRCCAVLCCAVPCYAMLCYAMLCYAMLLLCYAMRPMLCYAKLCYAVLGGRATRSRSSCARSPPRVASIRTAGVMLRSRRATSTRDHAIRLPSPLTTHPSRAPTHTPITRPQLLR